MWAGCVFANERQSALTLQFWWWVRTAHVECGEPIKWKVWEVLRTTTPITCYCYSSTRIAHTTNDKKHVWVGLEKLDDPPPSVSRSEEFVHRDLHIPPFLLITSVIPSLHTPILLRLKKESLLPPPSSYSVFFSRPLSLSSTSSSLDNVLHNT